MKKYLIWTGKYYTTKYLTQDELFGIIKLEHEQPVLNSRGEMLTTEDLDWEE